MWRVVEDSCSAILLLIMVTAGTLQVVGRYVPFEVFDLYWTEEFTRLLLVWLTFWGASMVQRGGGHISLSVFADLLPGGWQRFLHLLSDGLIIAVLAFLAWQGWTAARLIVDQQTVGLGVSLAVFAYSVPFCSVLMICHTLFVGWRRIQGRPLTADRPEG